MLFSDVSGAKDLKTTNATSESYVLIKALKAFRRAPRSGELRGLINKLNNFVRNKVSYIVTPLSY